MSTGATKEIGILMTDSTFERLPGDIGNPVSWSFPVRYQILKGITPAEMMSLDTCNPLEQVISAADELINVGVSGITTTCGFLALYQQQLANHCSVPVATSSLLQVPLVNRLIPANKKVGILTYDASALSSRHLQAVGVSTDTPVMGIPQDSFFYRWIMEGIQDIDVSLLRRDVVELSLGFLDRFPDVGAIVAECTNLTPFSRDIALATNLPVFDTTTLVNWFHGALQPQNFSVSD